MLSIPVLIFSVAASAAAPHSSLVIAPCDAGEHYQFEKVSCAIELKNIGDTPIHVSKGEAKLEWDSIEESVVVAPHSTAYLDADVSLRDSFGYTLRRFRFHTDEPGQSVRGSNVRAFVSTVLDQQAPTLEFGTVDLTATMPSRSMTLSSREVKDFRITGISSKPDFLDVKVDADGRTVHATMRPNAPWGMLEHQKIKLKINAEQQSEAWITVSGDIHGAVVPNGNPFSMGLMRTGNKNEFLIQLTSRSNKDFQIGVLALEGVKGKVDIIPCLPAKVGCKLARVTVADDQPLGRFVGSLRVELPEFKQTLPVQLVGMLLTPDYPIHDFNKEMEKSQVDGGQSSAAPTATPKVDIKGAIKETVRAELPPPPGAGPLLRWAVANQAPIYGYLVYRADSESGPFLRVNKDIIRAVSSDDTKSGAYAWRDTTAIAGETYWYYIGMVNNDGSKKDLSVAQKIVVK